MGISKREFLILKLKRLLTFIILEAIISPMFVCLKKSKQLILTMYNFWKLKEKTTMYVRQFTHFYVVGESFKITFMIIATGYIDTEGKTDEASQKYLQRKIEN